MLSIWHCKSRIVWTNPCPVSLFLGENHNFHIVGTSMCSSYPYHIPIHQMVASFQTTIFGQTPTIQIHQINEHFLLYKSKFLLVISRWKTQGYSHDTSATAPAVDLSHLIGDGASSQRPRAQRLYRQLLSKYISQVNDHTQVHMYMYI